MNILQRLADAIDKYELATACRPDAILLSDAEANAVIEQLHGTNGLLLFHPSCLENAKLMGIRVLRKDRMVQLGEVNP